MKRRFLAIVGAMTLAIAMSLSVSAAGSPSSDDVAESSVPRERLATASQQLSEAAIEEFATTTTIKAGVSGAYLSSVSSETAAAAIAQAKNVVGSNAFLAAIVELNVPEGTGAATFTLGCPNVWAGQDVTILHRKKDGTWESIKPSKLENNAVTFEMTSYSPVAIVVDTTAPKTGDNMNLPLAAVTAMAVFCLAGIVVFGRRSILS